MKNWLLVSALFLSFGSVQAMDLPPQGMSMATVQKNFGTPTSKTQAIGRPPITRWIYPDYTVIFEYKHVVQSVRMVKEQSPVSNTATPQTVPAANEATIKLDVQQ